MNDNVNLILACAGKGERAKLNKNKLLSIIDGKTCFEKTLSAFIESKLIDNIIITASMTDWEEFSKIISTLDFKNIKLVQGGSTRTESVKNALNEIDDGIVLISDGARPFVDTPLISRCIETVKKYGSAIPLYPSSNTVVESDGKIINNYLGKSHIYSVQTPQGFFTKEIKTAYNKLGNKTFNDDGEVYKEYYNEVHAYCGDEKNIKLTYPEDFKENHKLAFRFGTGFDCHKLVENRKLILGGVEIPHTKGLSGHSDADVLTHAIMDAILSCLSLRDIGYHFSDKDEKYKDISSMILLDRVLDMIKNEGYKVATISASIMAEKPKLMKHIPTITENLSKALNIPCDKIGLTATTLEGLGFVGREEGICVSATAMLEKIQL